MTLRGAKLSSRSKFELVIVGADAGGCLENTIDCGGTATGGSSDQAIHMPTARYIILCRCYAGVLHQPNR